MMPRVHRVRKGENVFRYHRVTRAALPNDVPEDHPKFIAAWQKEEARSDVKPSTRARPIAGSVSAGCAAYLASREFRDLSESYRPIIRRHVDAIRAQVDAATGIPMLADLSSSAIQADLSPLSPAVASHRFKAWRKLGAFWKSTGMTEIDPTVGAARKRMPKTEGHREWTRSDVAAFRARWPIGTRQRLALELIQWTGARIVDAVRLGPQMVDSDGLLVFAQKKTKVTAYVPWTAPAFGLEQQRRDLMECIADGRDLVFMLTEHGKARSHKAASQWFAQAARDAGLVDLTAHGLRKFRMNELAEAGVSILGMQSWVGHLTLVEVEHYTRRAERRRVFFVNQSEKFTKNRRK